MNITQTLLKNLSGGELQKLAEEMLSKIYSWERLSNYGQVEGGFRTRKGTPDIWIENDLELIYLSATGDSSKGKLRDDIEKSLDKFREIKVSKERKCIGFLNYDPDSKEVDECRNLCESENVKFEYYTNYQISNLLDKEHQELRKKYLNIKFENDKLSLLLASSEVNSLAKVHLFIENIEWLNNDEKLNLSIVVKELLSNAMDYGEASRFEIQLYDQALAVIDDGKEFDLTKFDGTPTSNFGGGKQSLNVFSEQYPNIKLKYKWKKNSEENIYSFINVRELENAIRINENCELELNSEIPDKLTLNIPKKCNEIIIKIPRILLMMSKVMRIDKTIRMLLDDELYSKYTFKIIVPMNLGMLEEQIEKLGDDVRVTIEKRN